MAATPQTAEPIEAPRIVKVIRSLGNVDVAAKIETSIVMLEHAANRADQVAAGGNRNVYSKVHGRLRQSAAPFQDLLPGDGLQLSVEERWSLGLRLGVQLSRLVSSIPPAIERLEADGKTSKAAGLDDALQRTLDEIARKLPAIPIASPDIAALLGDPPRIDAENAPQIMEKLKSDLAQPEGRATPDQRLAALFLTDSVAGDLKAALAAKGGDTASVDELASQSSSRRQRLSLAFRRGAVVGAILAVGVPALVFAGQDSASTPSQSGRDTVAVAPAEPAPTVDRRAVHNPITIRTAEAPQQREMAKEAVRQAITTAPEDSTDPASIPPELRQTVREHLDAATFPVQRFVEAAPEGVDPIEQALATFQASVGLEPSGDLTLPTWEHLDDSIIVANPDNVAFSPPQEMGERSDAVRQSEQILADLNLLPNERVDGDFDGATHRASREFEDSHPGLGTDGAIDMEQFRTMVRELVQKNTARPDVVVAHSPNQSPRGVPIDGIVLHHTASNDTQGDLATLRSAAAEVSANFLIGRDGTIFEVVPEENAAWHAGDAVFNGGSNVNARTIGIEITNDGLGQTPFTPEQYRALERLLPYLAAKYDIPVENIVGHKDVAIPAGRKVDPAPNFDEGRVLAAVERVQQLERLG